MNVSLAVSSFIHFWLIVVMISTFGMSGIHVLVSAVCVTGLLANGLYWILRPTAFHRPQMLIRVFGLIGLIIGIIGIIIHLRNLGLIFQPLMMAVAFGLSTQVYLFNRNRPASTLMHVEV